jgi:hypothetical protein
MLKCMGLNLRPIRSLLERSEIIAMSLGGLFVMIPITGNKRAAFYAACQCFGGLFLERNISRRNASPLPSILPNVGPI